MFGKGCRDYEAPVKVATLKHALGQAFGLALVASLAASPVQAAGSGDLESAFDRALGTQRPAPEQVADRAVVLPAVRSAPSRIGPGFSVSLTDAATNSAAVSRAAAASVAPLPANEVRVHRNAVPLAATYGRPTGTLAAPQPAPAPSPSRFATPAIPAPTGIAAPVFQPRSYASPLEAQVAALSNGTEGRIGVAAFDLATGRSLEVLGNQPFPLASTSKIAIAATYLDGVDRGIYRLDSLYPLMVPLPSKKFSTSIAPVRQGTSLSAQQLMELSLTRSDNQATDALLAAIGGPQAVTAWLRRAGITDFRIDRDIATLVRDDGAIDPAFTIDPRDSVTPLAMVRLLAGLYRGQFLSGQSRALLLATMERCVTGKRRIPGMLPEGTRIAHKTGTLSNTTSDVGIVQLPDGRSVALAIYVTGQGSRMSREARIAAIARVLYDGYQVAPSGYRVSASR
jgi:beta-lactamase class A